jgi:hypothetical protein
MTTNPTDPNPLAVWVAVETRPEMLGTASYQLTPEGFEGFVAACIAQGGVDRTEGDPAKVRRIVGPDGTELVAHLWIMRRAIDLEVRPRPIVELHLRPIAARAGVWRCEECGAVVDNEKCTAHPSAAIALHPDTDDEAAARCRT